MLGNIAEFIWRTVLSFVGEEVRQVVMLFHCGVVLELHVLLWKVGCWIGCHAVNAFAAVLNLLLIVIAVISIIIGERIHAWIPQIIVDAAVAPKIVFVSLLAAGVLPDATLKSKTTM